MAPTGVKLAQLPKLSGLIPRNAAKTRITATIAHVRTLIFSIDIIYNIEQVKIKNITIDNNSNKEYPNKLPLNLIFVRMIQIFTDGASSGNPGPGGYGVILRKGSHYKELSGGFRKTTNNRMELLAVITGLEAIKNLNQDVTIYSDSKYIIDSVEKKWLDSWIRKGFVGKKNKDLWMRFHSIYKQHRVRFIWVKGHAGHPENERCDTLAVEAAKDKNNWKIDSVFETEHAKML